MAVPDVPADLILNERSSFSQYLWLLPGVVYYRWDDRVDYMYAVGATPVEGQGLPPKPPVQPIGSPFNNGQNEYLGKTFIKTVNGEGPDGNGNVTVDAGVDETARAAAAGAAELAEGKYTKPGSGIPFSDLATGVVTSLDGINAGKLAPIKAARPGNRFVFLGDSITQGSDQASTNFRGTAWPLIASIRSAGRIVHVRNSGISGNTTQNMLDRFDTDVTPYAPAVVSVLAGTNDSAPATFVAWTQQIQTLVAKIRSIGAVPILCTVPPTALAVWRQQTVQRQNTFLRDYANRNGITLVDFFALLVEPTTGGYKTAYYNDGIHPNAAGYAAMGTLYNDVVTPTLPAYSPLITLDDTDPYNLISGGCFTGASGTAIPTGWQDNAGTPAGSSIDYVANPSGAGQLMRVTSAATTGIRQIARVLYSGSTTLSSAVAAGATSLTLPIRADYRGVLFIGSGSTFEVVRILSSAGGGPQTETLVSPLQYAHAAGETVIANAAPGDLLAFSGRVNSDAGVSVTASIGATGGASTTFSAIGAIVAQFNQGVFSQHLTVPAGTNTLVTGLQNNNGTGVISWGQVGLYNLTRMGLA